MSKKDQLTKVLATAKSANGGIHTARELAYMMGETYTPAFKKFLADGVEGGVLRRVARGLYESTITPPEPTTAIYKIINKLRAGVLNYISLESQLSHTGEISQIVMGRVTVMTKGRSGIFSTPYGVIEFIHTKKSVASIAPNLYVDSEIGMHRANIKQAKADLKDCNRNLQMLEN